MKKNDFGSIFQTNTEEKIREERSAKVNVISIPYDKCINWKYSDRNKFELGDIEKLAEDIQENGQIQPITVREIDGGLYEVIAGERRWRACQLINKNVNAVIVEKDDLSSFLTQISENNRKDISSYSKAMSYSKIIRDGLITQNMLAKKIGYKTNTFSELMSYSYIPEEVWEAVGDITNVSISTAVYMRKLINEDKISNTAKLISISEEIRKGAGKRKIQSLLSNKQSDVSTKNYFYSKGNNIEIACDVLKVLPMKQILEILNKEYLNRKNKSN